MVSIFPWNPEWETGEPAIDQQHRQLLDQLGRLMVALAEGREGAETERALLLMGVYIDQHFKDEETLMARSQYPGLEHHRLIHEDLRDQVRVLMDFYVHDPRAIPASVMDFLLTWLKDHLAGEDRLLAEHLRLVAQNEGR
jgi:hemerythrin-like metal-binding protein